MKFDNRLLIIQTLFFILISFSIAYARHFEPGEFKIALFGDRTGDLKDVGIANKEIKFADKETGAIVYSRTYDNSTWYPQCNFSPDGRTLYILWQSQNAHPGGTSKQIELIDIYNNRLINRYDVLYEQNWDVTFSLCSNIAYVVRYSSNGIGDRWNIGYSFVDLKASSGIDLKSGSTTSKCAPPKASITADGKNIRLTTCDGGDILTYPVPNPAASISNDPDPVLPPVTVIAEGLIEGSAAYKSFRFLSSLAKKTLNKVFQSSTFPVIKYAVRVIGSDSRTISGLGAGSFQVKENGVAQTITGLEFQSTNVPVDIALCLDTSGSISDTELAQINSSAGKFIDCFSSSDRGAIYKFSSNVKLVQGFSSDKDSLKNAINASPPERAVTSLNDAVYDAITLCRQSQNRKAVVAITDGYDNDSSHSLQGIIDYSSENQVPVFTLGLGSPLNVSLLQSMAAQCRGIYFNAITVNKLDEVFNKVTEDVHSRYVITYTTNNSERDGTTRSVETTVVNGASSGSAAFQYRAPQGTKPVAQILLVFPNPASTSEIVVFQGVGVGGFIVDYYWRSSIDGEIGRQESSYVTKLTEGKHTIYFKVKNSDGLWSDEVSTELTVLNKITISGKVRYENRIFNETGIGDPEATEFKPVRFAHVDIISGIDNKTVLGKGETNDDGTYTVDIKASLDDKIHVRCSTHQYYYKGKHDIYVGTCSYLYDGEHYKDSKEITISTDNLVVDLDITEESGEGGAFNIFDCLVDGEDKVKELSGAPALGVQVIWEKGKKSGSFYDDYGIPCSIGYINIGGDPDDPDEYDDSVILHEYGHFVMHNYSCDNSPGGHHQAEDTNQDIRLSWSEGWADYFSGMVRDNPVYLDIKSKAGQWIAISLNIETLNYSDYGSLLNTAQGQDTEIAVSSILWDLYDSRDDDDTLSLVASFIWGAFAKINNSNDCVLEDFYNNLLSNPVNEIYRSQINDIFASRKVFYSDSTFKRGKIFTGDKGGDIPNGGDHPLNSPLSITDNLFIRNLNVFVDISHGYKSDLLVKLISPSNKEVILHNHTSAQSGQSQDIFVWYQASYETIPDDGLTALDKFKGEKTQGQWMLEVKDAGDQQMPADSRDDVGKLNRWKLEIKGIPAEIKVEFQPGWNFVSFPLLSEDKSINNVLSSIDGSYSQVSRYNPVTKTFEHYVGDVNYNQFSTFEYGRGYQIFVTNPSGCSLIITGKPAELKPIILKAGWNLVGTSKWDDLPVEEALNPLQLGIDYLGVCRYLTSAKTFENYTQDKKEFTILKLGEAYYLRCLKDVNWTVEP